MCFMGSEDTKGRPTQETRWDASAYAANTAHHRAHDGGFLATTPLEPAMTVVDVGCGSGDFTRAVAQLVPRGTVIGVDSSADLLAIAGQDALHNQRFLVGRAQDLATLIEPPEVDAIVSRAALHWVPADDHPRMLSGMFAVLRPGGFLRIEMGGAGNIEQVARVLGEIALGHGGPQHPWSFPTDRDYRVLVEAAGFHIGGEGFIGLERQHREFDEAAFSGWLHSQVLNAFETGFNDVQRAAFRTQVAERMTDLRSDEGWDQEFVRLQLLAFKPS